MPQIAQIAATYASQIFWLLIIFGLIYFVIGKGMLPKIEATVDARDQKIATDLAAAEAARAKADETEASYRARIEEARAAALKATQDAKSAATAEAEKRVKSADAELAAKAAEADAALKAAQAKALAEIENVAAEAAQEIVAKISGITVDKADAAGAVKAALAA
ncbi:ATPase [Sphingomonadaceae bacterium G21617-S1]|jgi:F-type H+-transporting ATPase subunit b|uniref:F0F1 ATP synthase subunit B family protein n=1 Tax=Rhizorhabdus sp. TaxID=1968843 RepID=UPI00121D9B4F|nr:ATPase [Rhizorhabdus sp.]MBD3759994.1 ATPase [Rhizorhabdus sp.]MCZ4343168.1 ATPase [Sphingomonadaceae bacterium G21617-S1]TAK06151.1 MAG: ATPase [Rhizorhabdus sp.]